MRRFAYQFSIFLACLALVAPLAGCSSDCNASAQRSMVVDLPGLRFRSKQVQEVQPDEIVERTYKVRMRSAEVAEPAPQGACQPLAPQTFSAPNPCAR